MTITPQLLAEDPAATSFPIELVAPTDETAATAEPTAEAWPRAEEVGAFAERLVGMLGASTELLTVELGRRFGLYRALAELGPLTAPGLAATTGIAPRYAREWLEQQAAAGILAVDDGTDQDVRRFTLPAAHVPVLVDELHPAHAAPVAGLLAGVALAFPSLVEDYRLGRGVAFDAYGAEIRHGLGAMNRIGFTHLLRDWVGTLPDRAAALAAGGTVLDAGCGTGWSSIELAKAFPDARVIGIDLDEASIQEARDHAEAEGVDDRVVFVHGNAGDTASAIERVRFGDEEHSPRFELVTVFEALHDMGHPVDALAEFRALLRPGGAVLVADERVAEAFHADAEPVERMLYAMSVLHCLPATTAESGDVANGTVLRPSTLRRWAAEAGFAGVEVLDIEHPFWRFYRVG